MLRLRSTETLKTAASLLSVAAISAMPAIAAEERADGPRDHSRSAEEAREREHRREAKREPSGPFVPLVGKADYGTTENAFGAARSGHVHAGQDIFAPAGTPLVAVTDTVVADAGADGGQGNYVHLYDRRRERTYVYMHMVAPPTVQAGERVEAGERVGAVGCTGSCWGDHLHFEVREGRGFTGEPRDPMPLIRDWKPLHGAR